MARFPDEWIQSLLNKTDIVDVVSSYVTLQNKSGRLWGLCPFHNEKTPSFCVTPEKQIYYCFGCHQGGDVIHFLMSVENLTFIDAVKHLADKAGLPIPEVENDANYAQRKKEREKLLAINKSAARFFYTQLFSGKGQEALAYLKHRGIPENSVKRFGLGYAPDEWDALIGHLKGAGYQIEDIKKAGLAKVTNNQLFDAFKDRLIFPIINTFGDVIGFGGRVIKKEDDRPKYLNTKETPVFNKRRNLYGLNLAKKIRGMKHLIIVEGYMDVVSLSAAGVKPVVATLGTALSAEQAGLMKRYAGSVFIGFDGDSAGQAAALRSIDILAAKRLNVRVITFPGGNDPDDFIRENGLDAFKERMAAARTRIDFKLDLKKAEFDLKDAHQRTAYCIAAVKILSGMENPVETDLYIGRLAAETGIGKEMLKEQLEAANGKKNSIGNYRYNRIETRGKNPAAEISRAERQVIAYLCGNPGEIERVTQEIDIADYREGLAKRIINLINDRAKRGILPSSAEIVSGLEKDEDKNRISEILHQEDAGGLTPGVFEENLAAMKKEMLLEKIAAKRKALNQADEKKRRILLAELSELNKNLQNKRFETRS